MCGDFMKRFLVLFTAAALCAGICGCTQNKLKIDTVTQSPCVVGSDVKRFIISAANTAEDITACSAEVVPVQAEHIPVEKINLSKYSATLTVGNKFMPIVTMLPENADNKDEIWESDNTDIATVNKYGNITAKGVGKCKITVKSADNPEVYAVFELTVNEPEKTELTYIDGILIVNKTYALPSNYNPGTNPEAKAALDKMFADAAKDGCSMRVVSGFRSYNIQKGLYQSYVRRDGVKNADRYSARAGHSEHQTGLAFDINDASSSFTGTKEAIWLEKNAYKYGFILRYPQGKEDITGYMFEPWHYRYVGVQNAEKLFNSGLTIEEYYNITSVYS